MLHSRRFIALIVAVTPLVPAGPLAGQETAGPTAPPALVAPEAYLGHRVGADFKLADWEKISGYFELLGSASAAVRVDTLGRTTQDRPFILATVTAPENMARLEEIRLNQTKLADPRRLGEGDLESLLASQPAVVLISHNIHGTEIASSQGVMELAYTLATDPELAATLEDVVVLLIPSVNPDGQQMVSEWYERTLGTPYEGGRMPWLYHYYVGHDNNRDFYMLTQVESRLLTDLLYQEWFPEVVYDVHQMGGSGARFFVPPFDNPANPNIDPLLVRMISLYGLQISTDLEAAGKSGVVNASRFDLWWHGGLRTAPARHNMIGILSESASARLASPIFLEPGQVRQPQHGINFPNPWPGGWWHIRDIIDYQLIAAQAVIGLAARERPVLIGNFVELGRRAIAAGSDQPPFAYVIPAAQRDVGSAAAMLEVLRRGAVEIHRADTPFEADGLEYPAGSWVVLMEQPYRAHAKDLLERQVYPDLRVFPGGPPDTPYDAAGWTLPLQMGVEAVEVLKPFEADLQMLVDGIRPPAGRVTGSGQAFIVANTTNAANLAVHRLLAAGGKVAFLSQPAQSGDRLWPVGSAVFQGANARGILEALASEEGLSAQAFSGVATGYQVEGLRVGLYQPWTASMDEGWTRWVFDGWDLPYRTLHDTEIRAGDLGARYDVIVLPDVSASSIIEGRRPGTVPSEYAGGLGDAGTAAIRAFVRAGGTLVCIDSSSEFAIEQLKLPIEDVRPTGSEQRSGDTFYAPGSILAIEIDGDHPLGYGMPEETIAYYSHSPIFEVDEDARNVTVVARHPEAGQLLSGYALHPEYLSGKAALVEARYGSGRVVLFGFRPQYRGQSHETFKILFNTIYRGASHGPDQLEF
ncbi:MAG: peptidase M14 [Gemmatimonadetes bacterium]|nr:peptidase M14 [Gemmatimonadota bacterium]NIO32446.1 peptidase M14 [Gemmatimonadota bacterium]